MGQDATVLVLKTSALGTFRIFVVMLAGILASKLPKREPLLTRETCRTSSRVCALLFQTSLVVSSVGSTLTPSTLLDSWQLVFAAGFTILMSFATAGILGRVFLKPQDRHHFHPVQLAVAFHNPVSFPLLLVDGLCQQDSINGDFDGDSEDCFTRATGMIFIYYVVWQILFYAWGFPALGRDNTLELKVSRPGDRLGSSTNTVDGLSTTERTDAMSSDEGISNSSTRKAIAGDRIAVDVELNGDTVISASTTQEHKEIKGDTNSINESDSVSMHHVTISTAADNTRESSHCAQSQLVLPNVAIASVAGGQGERTDNISMGQTWTSTVVEDRTRIGYRTAINHRAKEVLLSPNIIAVFLGIMISFIPSLQEMLFTNTQAALWPLGAALQTLGMPTVALSTVVMAGSLLQVPMVAETANGERTWSRSRILIGVLHVGCRLIMVPAAGFALFWLANTQSTTMGSNRLMHVIILIQFAMPSAAMVIVSLNQLSMPATAGFMARLYIVQYGLSMLTVSAWTTVALRMVY